MSAMNNNNQSDNSNTNSVNISDAHRRQVLEAVQHDVEAIAKAHGDQGSAAEFERLASAMLHRNYARVLQYGEASADSAATARLNSFESSTSSDDNEHLPRSSLGRTQQRSASNQASASGFVASHSSSASFAFDASAMGSVVPSPTEAVNRSPSPQHLANSIYEPLAPRDPTFYDLEVARLGTNAVRFVKLTDIPTIVPIRAFQECNKNQKRFFWYAGQHFPEFADMSLHQCTPNLIFLITGICPLTVSGWRIRGGEYTLYVYFRSERDLRLARALMNGRVQMSRDENGEPGAIIYAQPGMAHPDGVKPSVFPSDGCRLPEPELSFRLEPNRPSTRRQPAPPRYDAPAAVTAAATSSQSTKTSSSSSTSSSKSNSAHSSVTTHAITPTSSIAVAFGGGQGGQVQHQRVPSGTGGSLTPPRGADDEFVALPFAAPTSNSSGSGLGSILPLPAPRGGVRGRMGRGSAFSHSSSGDSNNTPVQQHQQQHHQF